MPSSNTVITASKQVLEQYASEKSLKSKNHREPSADALCRNSFFIPVPEGLVSQEFFSSGEHIVNFDKASGKIQPPSTA